MSKKKKKKSAAKKNTAAKYNAGGAGQNRNGETKEVASISELTGEGNKIVNAEGEVISRPEINDPEVDYPPEPAWSDIPAEDASAAGSSSASDNDMKIFATPVKASRDGFLKRMWDKSKFYMVNKPLGKAVIKCLLVVAAVLVLIFLWNSRNDLSLARMMHCAGTTAGDGSGFPVTLSGSRSSSLEELAGNIAALTDTTFSVYNLSGREIAVRSHFMSSPAMKTAGKYALLLDIGNKAYRLETAAKTITTGTTDERIVAGAVSLKGRYAIVTQGAANSSLVYTVEVFDRRGGKSLHKWSSATCCITDIALSPDGRYFAVCGVDAEDGKLISHVIIQKIGVAETAADIVRQDNMLIALEYTSAGTIFAIGDDGIMVISDGGAVATDISHDGELMAFDTDCDNGVALCTSPMNGECTLTMYDIHGEQRFSEQVPLYGLALSVSDSGCTILGRGELRTYRTGGSMSGSFQTNAASSDALTCGGASFVLDGVKINCYN